jgi:hypothetical protein
MEHLEWHVRAVLGKPHFVEEKYSDRALRLFLIVASNGELVRIVLMTLYTFSASVETRATVIFLQIETPGLLVPSRLSRRFDKADH